MALNIDQSRPLRSDSQLEELVRAVFDAAPHDETDWLEWKSRLDLSKAQAWAEIARTVIGMANRNPALDLACGGLGYIVVGVEPGNLHGISPVDPAVSTPSLRSYLGPQGPDFGLLYVASDGMAVLVVVVEAPQPGDYIHCLHKENRSDPAGAILVRHHGTTERASPGDIAMLQERLLAGATESAPSVAVALVGEPIPSVNWDSATERVSAWVEGVKTMKLREAQEAFEDTPEPTVGLPIFLDERAVRRHAADMDEWAERYVSAAINGLPDAVSDVSGRGLFRVAITSSGDAFLSNVELRLLQPVDSIVLASEPDRLALPPAPPLVTSYTDIHTMLPTPTFLLRTEPDDLWARRPAVAFDDNTEELVFAVGDVRPGVTCRSEAFWLGLTIETSDEDEPVVLPWRMTSPSFPGQIRGEIAMATQPVNLPDVVSRLLGS